MLDLAPRRNALTWVCPPALPVAKLVIGRKVDEAAALLPLVLNLCRGAQELAARLAFGLPLVQGADEALHAEILRDHVLMLAVRLPRHFGGTAMALPQGWAATPALLRGTFFGAQGRMPLRLDDLEGFLRRGEGLGTLLRQVRDSFLPSEAGCDPLPVQTGAALLEVAPIENSVAARWIDHPLMRATEAAYGRGPFWRVLGRVIELDALIAGVRMPFRVTPEGQAMVPAARGTYAVFARTEGGIVTEFARVTPTDHLLAPGGVFEQALARLPDAKTALAPLVLDIMDPCVPLRLEEAEDA